MIATGFVQVKAADYIPMALMSDQNVFKVLFFLTQIVPDFKPFKDNFIYSRLSGLLPQS